MDSKSLFLDVLKRELAPYLRDQGFKGSGQNFYRVSADLIHVINLQASKWGDGFAANLGLHPVGMKIEGTSIVPDPKRLKEYECLFRRRLSKPSESDRWWKHRGFLKSPERSARSLIDFYKKYGERFFGGHAGARSLLDAFDLDTLNSRASIEVAGERMRIGRAGIVGAWLAEHLGDYPRAAKLAQHAYANRWERWPFTAEVARLQKLAEQ